MTRLELIGRLSRRFAHLPAKIVDTAVRLLLDQMSESVASGKRVEIQHFGSFFCRTRNPLVGRNPKTGAPVQVERMTVARFRPAKRLIGRLNGEKEHPAGTGSRDQ